MPRISVNPEAEVSQFNPVKAGVYKMRVTGSEQKKSQAGNDYIEWQMKFVSSADELKGIDNQPLKGQPSNVRLRTMLSPELQWKLRALVESALGEWRDFDEDELYGKEVEVKIEEEEYEGTIRNTAGRVLVPKQ